MRSPTHMAEFRMVFLAPLPRRIVFFGLIAIFLGAGCRESKKPDRPLRELDPDKIPAELRFPKQPREVVGVLTSKSGNTGIVGIGFNSDGTRLAGGFGSGHLVVWN